MLEKVVEQTGQLERALAKAANELAETTKKVETLTAALEDRRLKAEQSARDAAAEKRQVEQALAEARGEASELRSQFEAANTAFEKDKQQFEAAVARSHGDVVVLRTQLQTANAALEQDKLLKGEHQALTQALSYARLRSEQLEMELSAKSNCAQESTASQGSAASNGADQRLRRQFLVMTEILQAIDQLLSPRYGRLTIPVRQIRVRLVQVRQILDDETALTRRR